MIPQSTAEVMLCWADASGGEQMNGPLLAFLRCAVSTLPLVEHLCLLKCFHPMAPPDSIFATQCRNCMHIHRLRTLVVQTWSLLIAVEAVSSGCSSMIELLLPCTKHFLPERGGCRAGMNGSSLTVKQGEGVGECS